MKEIVLTFRKYALKCLEERTWCLELISESFVSPPLSSPVLSICLLITFSSSQCYWSDANKNLKYTVYKWKRKSLLSPTVSYSVQHSPTGRIGWLVKQQWDLHSPRPSITNQSTEGWGQGVRNSASCLLSFQSLWECLHDLYFSMRDSALQGEFHVAA